MATNRLVVDSKCWKCKWHHKNIDDQKNKIKGDDVETVIDISYLGNRINSGGGCVVTVASETRLGWVKFRECQDLLCGKKFPLKIIEVYTKAV